MHVKERFSRRMGTIMREERGEDERESERGSGCNLGGQSVHKERR